MLENKYKVIYDETSKLFPNARCELNYNNLFELLVSVVLSAQTTDQNVNKVTPVLFEKYPDSYTLGNADYSDVCEIIKSIGLAKNKAKNIINLSRKLFEEKGGIVPADHDYLVSLPGVGNKTANVILAEGFNLPAMPVDTHILRISNRLGLSKSDNPDIAERDLKNVYPEELWASVHIKLLFFGRYLCKAKNPNCAICPFKDNYCTVMNKGI